MGKGGDVDIIKWQSRLLFVLETYFYFMSKSILSACTYRHHVYLVPEEVRRGLHIHWDRSYRQLSVPWGC